MDPKLKKYRAMTTTPVRIIISKASHATPLPMTSVI
jgi:hypothetical protein